MGSKVLSYFAYVTVMCVYISQPVVAASRNHALLSSVATLIDELWYKCSDTVGSSSDERLTNVGKGLTKHHSLIVYHT